MSPHHQSVEVGGEPFLQKVGVVWTTLTRIHCPISYEPILREWIRRERRTGRLTINCSQGVPATMTWEGTE